MSSFNTRDSNINVIPVYDTRVDVRKNMKERVDYILEKPLHEVDYHAYSAESWDNNQASWSTTPNDRTTFMARDVWIDIPLRAQYLSAGTPLTPDLPIWQSNRDAIRSYAFERIMLTCKMSINGNPVDLEPYEFIDAYSQYQNTTEVVEADISPNLTDKYQNYSTGEVSNYNVLGGYIDNVGSLVPRGSYPYEIITNTNTLGVIQTSLRSKIRLPPLELLSAKYQLPSLVGLDRVTWKITFGNLQKAFSRSDEHPVPLSAANISIYDRPTLYIKWITVPVGDYRSQIERSPGFKYPLYIPIRYTQMANSAPVAPFTEVSITSAPLSVVDVPHSIYVYVTNEDTVRNTFPTSMTLSDVFWSLENVNITAGIKTGVLSSCKPEDLYNISIKNGLKGTTLVDWLGTTNSFSQSIANPSHKIGLKGPCLRLLPGLDFNIDDDIAMGSSSRFNFQLTVRTKNLNEKYSFIPQLCVIFVYEGYYHIHGNTAEQIVGAITPDQVANLVPGDFVPEDHRYFGGALFGSRFNNFSRKLSSGLGKANTFLKDKKLISKGLEASSYLPTRFSKDLSAAGKVAKHFGYGGCGEDCEGSYLDEIMSTNRGGGDFGGAPMPIRRLKKGLKKRK